MKNLKLYVAKAAWCAPCAAMKRAKTCEKLAAEKGLAFYEIDVEDTEGEEWSDENKVTLLPTMLLFKDGKEVARHEGAASLKDLRAWFEVETSERMSAKKKSL